MVPAAVWPFPTRLPTWPWPVRRYVSARCTILDRWPSVRRRTPGERSYSLVTCDDFSQLRDRTPYLSHFVGCFGTAASCLVLAVLGLTGWNGARAVYLIAGSALYLLGTLLVTIAFNVPLNDRLAKVDPESADGAALWTHYVVRWNSWNHVTTAASLAAAAAYMVALR